MVPMVMSPATPIPFSRYSGFDRHGISPIGAIAAAPMSYRVIAKLRHRKLSATLMAPRLTQLVGLTRARGQWRNRWRRISISRLSDRRRGGPAVVRKGMMPSHPAAPVNSIGWPHARARAVTDSAAADFYFAIIRSATGRTTA